MHLLLVALLRLRRAVKVCRQIATSSRIDDLVAEFDQQIPGLQLRHVWPRSVNTTAQEGSAESATSVLYIPDELAPAGGGTLRQGFAHDLVFAPARLSSGS